MITTNERTWILFLFFIIDFREHTAHDGVYPHFHTPPFHISPNMYDPLLTSCLLFIVFVCLFTNALIQVSAANMCVHKAGMIHWNVGNLPLAMSSIKNEPHFPGNSPVLMARQLDVGPSWISCILSILGLFLLALSCVGLVQGTRAVATLSSNKHFMCRGHHFTILLSIF